jgi:hypothetical protein
LPGEKVEDEGVAPLFVRDAVMYQQESAELAVEAGWDRDWCGCDRRGGRELPRVRFGAAPGIVTWRRSQKKIWLSHDAPYANLTETI